MVAKIIEVTVLTALALSTTFVNGASDPIVEISDGKILGRILQSQNKSDFYAFKEIPYAAPPVGDLRFAEPVNPVPWNGVLNASANTKICFQIGQDPSVVDAVQSEDCLYLNVFTPVLPGTSEDLLPVLFWTHGGAFTGGSIETYIPEWLIDYDVVVVAIEYRVGPFGFSSTMDGVIPGNLGLKDQRQALRWVQSNIKAFGGDPKRVTITGQSAGAISVSFLLLDPNSQGLFSAAIQQSGSAIMRGSYNPDVRNITFEWAKYLNKNFNSNDSSELLKLLRNVTAADIVAACIKLPPGYATGIVPSLNFMPVIEEENDKGNEYLLTNSMYEAFLNGSYSRVPILLGFNSEESLLWLKMSPDAAENAGEFDANYSRLIDYRLNVAPENLETMGKQLKQLYTNSTFGQDLGAYVKYSSDVSFTNAIFKQAQCTSLRTPTFLYEFSYAGSLGGGTGRPNITGADSIGHAEDLFYIWHLGVVDVPEKDLVTSRRMLKMWTNFIKYQNPTPEIDASLDNIVWPQTTRDDLRYLNINNTLEVMTHPRYYDKVNELHEKYMQAPLIVM